MSALAIMSAGAWTAVDGTSHAKPLADVVGGDSYRAILVAQEMLAHPDLDLKAVITLADMKLNNPEGYKAAEASHEQKSAITFDADAAAKFLQSQEAAR